MGYDNRCYLKANFVQQEAISYFTTLSTRIQSVQGYSDEMPVTYINPRKKTDQNLERLDRMRDIKLKPYDSLSKSINNYRWKIFMKHWCGFAPREVDPQPFVDLPEVNDMPTYPNDGSIRILHNTIVVKF